ncbi:RNase adapter RapZ [Oligoflexia bacterium]|nr:RNase adapter RapZ [Oligoflexia bacterium]
MKNKLEHISSLVIIAGIAGAGKSTASNVLSDLGFFSIDNLPVALLPNFLEFSQDSSARFSKTCLLLDIDSSQKLKKLLDFLNSFDPLPSNIKLIFLDCATNTIIKRYSETRRPHPGFDPQKDKTLEDTIQRERNRLLPLKEMSHFVIDSSDLNIHDLKRELRVIIDSFAKGIQATLRVNFLSFGFRYGLPPDCDLVVDVRFLPNPYFIDHLRNRTGLDPEVADYVLNTDHAKKFLKKYLALLTFLFPQYTHEGKAYLNIGVGCTGGKHRSVAIATALSNQVDDKNYLVSVKHRDLNRDTSRA